MALDLARFVSPRTARRAAGPDGGLPKRADSLSRPHASAVPRCNGRGCRAFFFHARTFRRGAWEADAKARAPARRDREPARANPAACAPHLATPRISFRHP
ncbi:hypothetical protein GSH05_10120 [Burkholderia pseudomallei]|uniref:Uncharacterized protein n=1 Tax=Burkholderia pseudomallei TaxID=28450 RepID=A0AAX0UCY1_BURPE|nr:hypothetical protein CXQ84_00215 [Burkholderia pseudomallei]MBK3334913.1 hypothetical protein [Burkholderia pseudomallei]MBM5652009.1 hypothetical protein [Burkholderia pseudomallei]MUU84303.1 hypothetical protein [Burkholderia pseudomallei]MWJ54917.1 hypothetical protein [Burkholderia pseudomallei]